MAKTIRLTMIAAALAVAAILPAYGQKNALPAWTEASWRAAKYPTAEWYSGFSQDAVKPGASAAEAQKRVEREAQNRMAEGITVRITSVATTQTKSVQTRDAKGVSEEINKNYGQIIKASTNAEVVKSELHSFHDKSANRVYAFAAVKKSDLAAYYTSRIEFYQQLADNELKLAKQYVESDRKGSATERLAEGKKNLGETGKYQELLIAVDYTGDALKRLTDAGAAMLREISALEVALMESGAVFITGKETILGNEVSRVVEGIQSKFTANGCRVADKREDAGYILTINVKECNYTPSDKFTFCNACVTADLVSAKTGKNEAKINFTGPKEGWTSAVPARACENAFNKAVDVLWKDIQSKTEVCK